MGEGRHLILFESQTGPFWDVIFGVLAGEEARCQRAPDGGPQTMLALK
jgi:hypothetical protein